MATVRDQKYLLRLYMAQADQTEKRVAAALGCTVGTVRNWVHGRNPPGVRQLGKLAVFLSLDDAQLGALTRAAGRTR